MKRGRDELETMLTALGGFYNLGLEINWESFYEPISRSKAEIPFYQFERKKYWFEIPATKSIEQSIDGEESNHPLLGTRIFHAGNTALFQNKMFLRSTKLNYLNDHILGETWVFPCAGFLEMSLAAGRKSDEIDFDFSAAVSSSPIMAENLRLEAPLGSRDHTCQFQISVSSDCESGNSKKVQVYGKVGGKWILNATAVFPAVVRTNLQLPPVDFLGSVVRESQLAEVVNTMYAGELKSLGYSYGPAFQTLQQFWLPNTSCHFEKVWETSILVPCRSSPLSEYFCHPTWTDAMLQAILVGHEIPAAPEQQFRVPVEIKRFTLVPQRNLPPDGDFSSKLIIHTFRSKDGDSVAVLYDPRNFAEPIATMEGVSFMPTTVYRITQAALGGSSLRSSLPQIMENEWVKASEFNDMKFAAQFLSNERQDLLDKFLQERLPSTDLDQTPQEMEAMAQLDRIVGRAVIKTFLQLGFNPPVDTVFSIDQIIQANGILPKQTLLLNVLFKVLEEDGWLARVNNNMFRVLTAFPPVTEIDQQMATLRNSMKWLLLERDFLEPCLSILPDVLKGTKSALPVLFPTDESPGAGVAPTANDFYITSKLMDRGSVLLSQVFNFLLTEMKGLGSGGLRILEVGAGTGSATRRVLPFLHSHNIPFSYTYTDISPAFFKSAELEFKDSRLSFKVLNLEEDPLAQGFAPGQFHIVLASMVLHATKDLMETLSHLRMLTKPGGQLVLFEGTRNTRLFDCTFGLLHGYWRFTDFELRNEHCLINQLKWHAVLAKCGFTPNHHINVNGNIQAVFLAQASQELPPIYSCQVKPKPTWIIFPAENKPKLVSNLVSLFAKFNRDVIQVDTDFDGIGDSFRLSADAEGILYLCGLRDTTEQSKVSKPLLHLFQRLISNFNNKKARKVQVVVVTEGVVSAKLHNGQAGHDQNAPARLGPTGGTLWGMCRSFRCEYPVAVNLRCVDLDGSDDCEDEQEKAQEVFRECWHGDGEAQVAYRKGNRFLLRLKDVKKDLLRNWEPLELPYGERFHLRLDSTRSPPHNLQFATFQAPPEALTGTHLEIQVKAFGLNFKGVLMLLQPEQDFGGTELVLGMDLVGVVTAKSPECSGRFSVGDDVIAVNMKQALPSHVRIDEDKVVALPPDLTFAEGATLPLAFATAYHCLVKVGRINAGETVLVHSAAGGVGLAAIQICLKIGATVIATVGSRRKQAYLRSIGVSNVFHSRSTDFAAEILQVTGGVGVDLVLNSLTSRGFKEASLQACARSGRFVEMSKLNVWTAEDVRNLRPDVNYSIVDLSADSTDWKELLGQLKNWMQASCVKPLPHVRFDLANVRQALTYFQGGRHIGKVVLTVPEGSGMGTTIHQGIFNERSTYLISGAMGGIGFELAKWMLQKGARNLLLVGRKEPTHVASGVIAKWNSAGHNILAWRGDVGDFEECRRILNFLKEGKSSWPPLRGIMHAACQFSNATYEKTSWEIYEKTFKAKVDGAWNLHSLTTNYKLEHFVMFSSVVALVGGSGQGNYAAENAFLDSLAGWRQSQGLPATTINWGLWGDIGAAAHFEHPVFRQSSPEECFQALELLLRTNTTHAAVFDAKMSEIRSVLPQCGQSYLRDLKNYGEDSHLTEVSPNGCKNLQTRRQRHSSLTFPNSFGQELTQKQVRKGN